MTALTIHPIRKRPLHLEAVHELREAIIGGQFQPGARLIEAELCDALGISRTPLREAFKLLEAECLLRVQPSRGVFVTEITEKDVADLFEVVSQLESLAVSLAIQRMSNSDRIVLRHMHDEMMRLYRSDELRDCFQTDYEIHGFLVEKSGNAVLAATHASLMARTRRGRYVALFDRARWDEAMVEHERIMDAVESDDSATARSEMSNHVCRTGVVLRQTLINEQNRIAV